ncbi:ATP-binding protein, partial [Candidatus Poribacteria bacterium]|nr:ATP-binding protein [Candidatus Poribacteria bacterium]
MKKELGNYVKSPKDFERFCNLFLKKEVSSFVTVYGAEGRDQGIDAEYNGDYTDRNGNKRSGRFIFQYKFFDPTKDKKTARDTFIRTIEGNNSRKGELEKAYEATCDHYVLMTNTLLTAGNVSKIEGIKNEKGYTFSLTCWDAENIITMTDEFPYVLNSFREPHLPVFLSYEDMFRNQIKGEHRLLRYDYDTFGRENEIDQFRFFVQDNDKRLLVMYGSGGIGKTKLAIEFAKTVEQEHHDYEPLFVQIAKDSFEKALADIPPNRKYIFFVDDAHDYLDNLGGIKILLNSPGYSESKA